MGFKVKPQFSANDFKKDKKESCEQDLDNVGKGSSVAALTKVSGKKSNRKSKSITTSKSHNNLDNEFNNEDWKMAGLYRNVVEKMKSVHNLGESTVNQAIADIKEKINLGHVRGFRRFAGINFDKTSNCCGYLRRYAICHTGLVKKLLWHFLSDPNVASEAAKEEILSKNKLKVVSLGGGPGNDLVGFCAALQETSNAVKQLDLKIIDISQGWVSVFSSILRAAKTLNSGKLSELLQTTIIDTGFIQADLNNEGIFEDESVSSTIHAADVILMVKLASFLSDLDAVKLIQNVADAMSIGSKFIFIDTPYDRNIFRDIPSLYSIYEQYIEYNLSFKPNRYLCASIDSSKATIAIFGKRMLVSEEDSFSSEEYLTGCDVVLFCSK